VALKSGGYLIIDQTEALTTIDVNTGAYVGHRNLEETIYPHQPRGRVAIARQLRLRNLGGIIIIDFIDMEEEEHRRQVLQALEKALARITPKTHVSTVSPLGLVEMTASVHAKASRTSCACRARPARARLPQDPRRSATRSSARSCARPGSSTCSSSWCWRTRT